MDLTRPRGTGEGDRNAEIALGKITNFVNLWIGEFSKFALQDLSKNDRGGGLDAKNIGVFRLIITNVVLDGDEADGGSAFLLMNQLLCLLNVALFLPHSNAAAIVFQEHGAGNLECHLYDWDSWMI